MKFFSLMQKARLASPFEAPLAMGCQPAFDQRSGTYNNTRIFISVRLRNRGAKDRCPNTFNARKLLLEYAETCK